MPKIIARTGDDAVAEAMRQINPDVVAAYPITPQTEIVQFFSDFVANGKVKTELLCPESEHSAMSACIGASAAGGRVMTATSSQGLAYMWELVYIAASYRLPIVMPVVNRALSGPINIHCDHSDSMGARDSGWVQIFSENIQEAYDNTIQAVRIAEHANLLLPVIVTLDGFIISHAMEQFEILDDDTVQKFVGEYKPEYSLLDAKHPITYGPLQLFDYYMEQKKQQHEVIKSASSVVLQIASEFEKISKRKYELFEEYRMDDADIGIVVLGSASGTAKTVADKLREQGLRAGVLKIRLFRPFPAAELANSLSHLKALAVLDRSDTFGGLGGPVFEEVCASLYNYQFPDGHKIPAVNYIYGLGGRDVTLDHIEKVYRDLEGISRTGKINNLIQYLGVRE
ncbi:pyruvate ferredoxin oxidoreductase [Candidatus Desantisbacteria bacterium CG_4_10_14_0_8_um_filter_48_22]|uniref:Pyruvate ferredoxin oxidoreductase n=1 Tax=Candidatus Desantisbacteria bacterium CG_4_10_14_0_8_um_filter_48_22 TaxID=1974543 RepID=A0A2M7SFN9_9BACT|nr:MAG: pyruvate ferredoxin oxidoreductase [Candidatus Desantisbacteria bacterium CG1_02_49_89]PIV56599.1 MAG: pyruvate ferredoxin oxidoreductase [Candidatus Desantisbacteria bacterium CG02_land_8_20_14_3_00_49_13]PIZ18318.1 MAG: pyruvate ferredoxin oxidoreductase [Candidatus Desantisbacteria bacterium CG_4_10_14_0_8_um_filter_48_22]